MTGLTDDQIAEARRLYAEGKCPSDVAYRMSCYGRPRVTKEQVRAVITLKPNVRNAISLETRAKALKLYLEDLLTPGQIAKRLGIAERTARSAVHPVRRQRVFVASEAEAQKRRLRDAARDKRKLEAEGRRKAKPVPVPEPIEIEVPAWVPGHLHEFYEHRASRDGEEVAAGAVRALKRGGSVAHL